jgi:gamma-glutamyltranspeptidase/glutathione hydrolase
MFVLPVKPVAAAVAAALLLPTAALAAPSAAQPAPQTPAPKGHAMVVSVQHDASDAGLDILRQGGNAIDAAVAVGFALAVVYPRAGNIGGGGFMLIRQGKHALHGEPRGKTHFLDFRERAPQAATANMYLDKDGNVIPRLSTTGYKAIGVPGSVAGLVYAQQHFGRLTLQQDMAPAIRFATDGVVLSAGEAAILHNRNIGLFPESVRVFQRGGNFYTAGEVFKQPDLAATLTRIAANPDDFYHGEIAHKLSQSILSHGGLITEADLAAYKVADREPLTGQFKAHGQTFDIITSPPPSSGGIVLLETLNILQGLDLTGAGPDRSPGQVHFIAEAFRRAFMDRNEYLGDPDYNNLPLKQMASKAYAAAWRASISPSAPSPSDQLKRPAGFLPPPPPLSAPPPESRETTHFSIVDADGTAVSTTYTLNGYFGSGATAEGLGFALNNEMDDFTSKPGVMNMFHLIQGSANAIGPGHRPLSSMTPTIVTTHGSFFHRPRVEYVIGSPGGSTIPSTVINDFISQAVNGLNVQQASDAPRFYHQFLPDILEFEKLFPRDVVEAMQKMGYKTSQASLTDTNTAGQWGGSELITIDPKTHAMVGANDPRYKDGKVSSY